VNKEYAQVNTTSVVTVGYKLTLVPDQQKAHVYIV